MAIPGCREHSVGQYSIVESDAGRAAGSSSSEMDTPMEADLRELNIIVGIASHMALKELGRFSKVCRLNRFAVENHVLLPRFNRYVANKAARQIFEAELSGSTKIESIWQQFRRLQATTDQICATYKIEKFSVADEDRFAEFVDQVSGIHDAMQIFG